MLLVSLTIPVKSTRTQELTFLIPGETCPEHGTGAALGTLAFGDHDCFDVDKLTNSEAPVLPAVAAVFYATER